MEITGERLKPFRPITTAEIAVLDVGSGTTGLARKAFPNARLTGVDILTDVGADLVHDIRQPLPPDMELSFDIVFASHVLEHIPRTEVTDVVRNLARVLLYGGLLWAVCPSLEWAARELLRDKPSPAVLPVIYGGDDKAHDAHRVGFTMLMLRQLMNQAGLIVRDAFQGEFVVMMAGKTFPAVQNIVVAMRPQPKESDA